MAEIANPEDRALRRLSLLAIEVALGVWIGWGTAVAVLTADTLSTSIIASVGLLIAVSTAKTRDKDRP